MTRRIFRAIGIASLAVFLATMLLLLDVLYNYFTGIQLTRLRSETSLAAAAVEQAGMAFLESLDTDDCRISWISADGTVRFDSRSDSADMENHLQREEIRAALADGYGESSRYSSTLMEQSVYCARRLKDGTVLRLSFSHGSILLLLLGMLQPILVIVAIAAVLALVLAGRLSRRIVEPLNRLDLDTPPGNSPYPELMPLLRRIRTQQNEIRSRTATLKRKQDELDTLICSMQEGMLLLDADGKLLAFNRAAKELLNVPQAHMGDRLDDICRQPELIRAFSDAMEGRAADCRADLGNAIVQIVAAPVLTDAGAAGAAIVLFDITQRENAERLRREFTANVSHELKTPLHAISGYAELLKCGLVQPEDVPAFAGTLYDEIQRLIRLVEDIISLSRLDEGGGELTRTDIDLYAVAEDVAASLNDLAAQNGITIEVSGTNASVRGIPELVRGILYNLCDNAVKYNRPGGRVDITTQPHAVTIRDTGIGIPPEHLDRIFERFYRVDKGRSRQVGGTGLGLSIVKHAVAIHNAAVTVDSTVGKGTVVTVTFPE